MYSLHGLLALMRPPPGQVCHALIVLSNCTPGSAHRHAAYAMSSHSLRASTVRASSPLVRQRISHALPASTASKNLSGTRTELLLFWPLTLAYASPLKSKSSFSPRRLAVSPTVSGSCTLARSPAIFVSPSTIAATLISSRTFQFTKFSMSGWSMSRHTILAARRVVPPLLIALAARSPIFSQLISPLLLPPPLRGSPSPRRWLKFVPVPLPYLNSRASRTHRSMMPPSFTRSSLTLWMKHACGWGCSYAPAARLTSPVLGSGTQWPWAGPSMPYAQLSPVLNHCGLLGAAIWCSSMYTSSS